ncbi:hypothetical protein Enr8_28880 [Blastopirellula retiformator]|uniref:Uncharacterized protein n=1 Tax=Blastopirellula retiformator TaxID=2527970 RepID=A0A5C5V3E4_9BACT|nr:hypothetical protein Enr8_28880 [Blastopirellula retiformator]
MALPPKQSLDPTCARTQVFFCAEQSRKISQFTPACHGSVSRVLMRPFKLAPKRVRTGLQRSFFLRPVSLDCLTCLLFGPTPKVDSAREICSSAAKRRSSMGTSAESSKPHRNDLSQTWLTLFAGISENWTGRFAFFEPQWTRPFVFFARFFVQIARPFHAQTGPDRTHFFAAWWTGPRPIFFASTADAYHDHVVS